MTIQRQEQMHNHPTEARIELPFHHFCQNIDTHRHQCSTTRTRRQPFYHCTNNLNHPAAKIKVQDDEKEEKNKS